jgi:sec-independent protein translocase protein TatB
MFDIGWSEMLVVGAVALVVIGPKDLPGALRQAGKWMGAVRRMAADFQGQVNQAMRESELDELRREVQNLKSGVTDPVRRHEDEMRALVEAPPALPPPEATPAPKPASEPEAVKPAATKPVDAKPAKRRSASAKPKAAPKSKKPPAEKNEGTKS